MKWFILSDIHGSEYWCKKALERYRDENCRRILLLGDILYHGPRNDLPEGYNPKGVIAMLSAKKDSVLCVRGNCEAEVDQMVLPFPVMADYIAIESGDRVIFATHGHKYDKNNSLPMCRGDVMLSGHTHIPDCTEKDGKYYLNPGSVSLPKEGSRHSYMIYEDGEFWWKDLSGETYMTLKTLTVFI